MDGGNLKGGGVGKKPGQRRCISEVPQFIRDSSLSFLDESEGSHGLAM